jgi:hypothetical protein
MYVLKINKKCRIMYVHKINNVACTKFKEVRKTLGKEQVSSNSTPEIQANK